MSKYEKVSIIIPVYNEIRTIEEVLSRVQSADVLGLKKEIILIDDKSTDGTAELLRKISEPEIKVFFHEKNQGKGAALINGFKQATGDILIIQDADLEYDPAQIHKVLRPFETQNAQVVYGSRYLAQAEELKYWHSSFNKLFTSFANLLLGTRLTDIMTCYKAFTKEVLSRLVKDLQSDRFGFEPEVTARVAHLKISILEVPISYKPRDASEGKHMNFKGQIESLWVLIKFSL